MPPQKFREAFLRARTLCLRLGDVPEYFRVLFGLWGHSWMGGKNDEALRMAEEFLSRSQGLSDPVRLMVAHRMMGSSLLTIGDFRSSANHFEETIKLSRSRGKQPLYNRYMVEPQAASLLLLSWDLWFLGYPDQSLSRVRKRWPWLKIWPPLHRSVRALYDICRAHFARGCRSCVRKRRKKLEVSQEQRFALYTILSRIARGQAAGELGRSRSPTRNHNRDRRSAAQWCRLHAANDGELAGGHARKGRRQ